MKIVTAVVNNIDFIEIQHFTLKNTLYQRRFEMGRSKGALFQIVTGKLVEELK